MCSKKPRWYDNSRTRNKKQCVICRKRDKKVGQQMGMLPIERLQPLPAFYYCAVDMFIIRETVKKQTHGKAY